MDRISFVIPVFNEEGNLGPLLAEIAALEERLPCPWEVLFVDDGSTDGSLEEIRALAARHPRVRFLALARNTGQSAALAAGFRHASGDVIVTMDADLQNDPADVPALLEHFGTYQMINGWRRDRQDSLSKRLGSRVGNAVRNWLTGEAIRDTGCSLKVMDGAMLRRIPMFRGLHRFLPTLMRLEGARVLEVPVHHRPRRRGYSKYTNLRRAGAGLYDVIAVRWMIRRHLRIEIGELHVED